MTLNLASTYGDRSFAVSGSVAWNSLPVALWSGDVMAETFRRHLKTILFNCLAFLVPAHPGSPRQRAVKRVCVCVCVSWQLVV